MVFSNKMTDFKRLEKEVTKRTEDIMDNTALKLSNLPPDLKHIDVKLVFTANDQLKPFLELPFMRQKLGTKEDSDFMMRMQKKITYHVEMPIFRILFKKDTEAQIEFIYLFWKALYKEQTPLKHPKSWVKIKQYFFAHKYNPKYFSLNNPPAKEKYTKTGNKPYFKTIWDDLIQSKFITQTSDPKHRRLTPFGINDAKLTKAQQMDLYYLKESEVSTPAEEKQIEDLMGLSVDHVKQGLKDPMETLRKLNP